jgi:hypothetical protein
VGRTPDSHDGPAFEEGTYYQEQGAPASTPGELRFFSGRFSFFDGTGEYDPRSGSGISAEQHKTLRQLIHFIEEGPAEGFTSGAYKETLPSGSPFPTSITWWESSLKLKKIVERLITWAGAKATTDQWKIYDTDGSTVLWIVTDAISYSGIFETTRTRTIAAGP